MNEIKKHAGMVRYLMREVLRATTPPLWVSGNFAQKELLLDAKPFIETKFDRNSIHPFGFQIALMI
jgi:hypothetical protein